MKNNNQTHQIKDSERFSALISRKHWEFVKIANYELFSLLWKVGNAYNRISYSSFPNAVSNDIFHTIANIWGQPNGSYFSQKQLQIMGNFAKRFPNSSDILQEFSSVSWEHIVLLSDLEDTLVWRSYLTIIIEQGLSVGDLQKLKDHGASDNRAVTSLKRTKSRTPIWAIGQKNISYKVVGNFFTGSLLDLLRPLSNTTKIGDKNAYGHLTGEMQRFFLEFRTHIAEFKDILAKRLHAGINLFFWEFGKAINSEITDSISRKSLINDWASALEKDHGKTFSKEQLYAMSACAEQFNSIELYYPFAKTLSWDHILTLLPLDSLEAKLFYARLSATTGLNILALTDAMQENAFENTPGAIEEARKKITELQKKGAKQVIEKAGNKTTQINTFTVKLDQEFTNSKALPDVLESQTLMDFLSAHY